MPIQDPLKLLPLAICLIAAIGLFTGKMSVNDAVGLLVAAGILHPAISAINNRNPPDGK
jgi:hypothetical protein